MSNAVKSIVKKWWFWVIAVVVVVSVCVAVSLPNFIGPKVNDSIVGTWLVSQEKSTDAQYGDTYYTFKEDGTFIYTVDSYSIVGTYSNVDENKDNKTVTCNYEGNSFTYIYVVNGENQPRTLNLTDTSQTLNLVETDDYVITMETDEFVVEQTIIGKWENKTNHIVYQFNDDGTYTQSLFDKHITDGIYTITDNVIELTYIIDQKETNTETTYEFKGEQLILSDVPYSKVSE